MNRITCSLKTIFIAVVMHVLALCTASAQSSCPNTTWPYQFEEFKSGTIHYRNSEAESKGLFNIHLQGNVLQYVNPADQKVHKAETSQLDYLDLDSIHYVVREGRAMQLVYVKDSIYLLKAVEADWDALFTYQGAAYGMNVATAMDTATHPFNLTGLDQPLYETLKVQKHDGREILTADKYYIWYEGKLERPGRKVVEEMFHLDSKALKAFIKQDKTDWKSQESLQRVIDFSSANK